MGVPLGDGERLRVAEPDAVTLLERVAVEEGEKAGGEAKPLRVLVTVGVNVSEIEGVSEMLFVTDAVKDMVREKDADCE